MHSKDNDLLSGFSRIQSLIIIGLLIMAVVISFALGYFTRQLVTERLGNFSLLQEAHQILLENAYKEVPNEIKLEYGMIRGMLRLLMILTPPLQNHPQQNCRPIAWKVSLAVLASASKRTNKIISSYIRSQIRQP